MKTKHFFIAAMLFLLSGSWAVAQEAKTATIEIKTSAQCEKCKATIEKAMAFEKGVVKSDLDVETKVLKVTYKTARTNPETIRKAVSMAGYDADDVAADPKAYSSLSDCCKKPEDRQDEHAGHQ